MTEGLAVADCIRSLQSLSTEEKVKDWAGRCVCTSLLWYTCHYELCIPCAVLHVYTSCLICSRYVVSAELFFSRFATKTCYFVILFHPQKVTCSVSRCKHANTEHLEQLK